MTSATLLLPEAPPLRRCHFQTQIDVLKPLLGGRQPCRVPRWGGTLRRRVLSKDGCINILIEHISGRSALYICDLWKTFLDMQCEYDGTFPSRWTCPATAPSSSSPLIFYHIIDGSSPLRTWATKATRCSLYSLLVIMSATVKPSSVTYQVHTSYLPDEVLWGYEFPPWSPCPREGKTWPTSLFFDKVAKTKTMPLFKMSCPQNYHGNGGGGGSGVTLIHRRSDWRRVRVSVRISNV
uniref:Inward rectifier potassium channel C-terminal domain-containing protein n=1 Tax=Oncorhynchus mykiss TaxID=8022 RepID=A0A8K9XM17_ONCMY